MTEADVAPAPLEPITPSATSLSEAEVLTKRKQVLVERLAQLRNLMVYINSKLPNRQLRRQWWHDFYKHDDFRLLAIDRFIDAIEAQPTSHVPPA